MPSVDADAVRRGEVVDDRATIVDLCSGFGYLGMFLSEMLDPSKVKAIELVDKQWPMWTAARPTASQINWDHIRGVEGVRASELGGDRRRDRGGKKKVRSIHWSPYDRVRRGERRSLRTLPGVSLRPPLAFNPRPRRLSTPTDAFQLHPDIRLYRTAQTQTPTPPTRTRTRTTKRTRRRRSTGRRRTRSRSPRGRSTSSRRRSCGRWRGTCSRSATARSSCWGSTSAGRYLSRFYLTLVPIRPRRRGERRSLRTFAVVSLRRPLARPIQSNPITPRHVISHSSTSTRLTNRVVSSRVVVVQAIEMFNCHRTAATLVLKPCCLPEWNHTYTHDRWTIAGSEHVIETREVCAQGKWRGNRWCGPPRSHLRPKFEKWCDALCRAVDVSGAFYLTLVPIRPRRRGERRSLRTLPGASLRPGPSLSIPALDAFQLHLTPLNSTPTSLCMERPSGRDARAIERSGGIRTACSRRARATSARGDASGCTRRRAGRRRRAAERRRRRGRRDGGEGGRGGRGVRSSITLVPIRPRSRGERRSLRTFAVVSLRPGSLAFNPDPRRLSTPPDAFQLQRPRGVGGRRRNVNRRGVVGTPRARGGGGGESRRSRREKTIARRRVTATSPPRHRRVTATATASRSCPSPAPPSPTRRSPPRRRRRRRRRRARRSRRRSPRRRDRAG